MFGLNKDQNGNDIPTAHPTVVAQSNATLPNLPDSGSFPSASGSNKLPASASTFSAPVLTESMINPATSAASAPTMNLNEIGLPEPAGPPAETSKTQSPPVNLSNAYIATDPPHLGAKLKDDGAAKPTAASLMSPTSEDELLKMKQKALQSLAPLVDHLDQPPEEKFKTTMMLLQASDNAELVKDAFDAANGIKDDKTRAQALLDVVNEINYFTQHGAHSQAPAHS